jgi:hypothetical protein
MADIDLSLSVAKLVEEMRKAGGAPSEAALTQLAKTIGAAFQAKKEEVAILRLSSDGRMLGFVFPLKLAKIGAIPLTTAHSLAAKNIRDKRGEIVNNFSVYRHPTVFEAVDLSAEEKASPIQKIVSAPMLHEGKVAGVIQISRKGRGTDPLGPDFTAQDLTELTAVGSILGKYLSTLPPMTPASSGARPAPKKQG